jgi:outer membrane protein assembly factor BamB
MNNRLGRRPASPTNKPQGTYRSPQPYPSFYPYPPRNRSAEIITISLLVAAFVLLGLGGMMWAVGARITFGPTPTPTATSTAPVTATPDLRTTRVAEDFLTQQAYQMALLGTLTSTPMRLSPTPEPSPNGEATAVHTPLTVHLPGLNAPATPTFANAASTSLPGEEASPIEPIETATSNLIVLPIVRDNSPLNTPTPALIAELPPAPGEVSTQVTAETATPTETLTATPTLPVDTPSPTPTETIVPPSPTPLPTSIPTSIPVATDPPFVVGSLRGFTRGDQAVSLRLGPSTLYTATTNQLGPNTEITILNRNHSGEWIYICCLDNQPNWVRQAHAQPRDNVLQPNAPTNSNPNDVRLLPIQPALQSLPPLPSPVPPGPDDYPLYRYDRHGQGRVDQLPSPPLTFAWPAQAQAGAAFGSPVAVMGESVLVGSADNHLYSFDRLNGHQRWRYNLDQQITMAPMIYQNEIFVTDQSSNLYAFGDQGNAAVVLWRVGLPQRVLTSMNIFSDTIFIATGEGSSHNLLAIDRDNGAILRTFATTGPGLRYPVIGDQLVYAADSRVTALDVFNGEVVWEQTATENISAGPVYGVPGLRALAELYVVSGDNRIYALDANTGAELWNIDNGEPASSMALNESTLFVAGNGYVKAISRQNSSLIWRSNVAGEVMGGPLVDANRLIVVTQFGNIQFLEVQTGASINGTIIPAPAGGAAAVSGPWLYIPGADGRLYALLGTQ